VIISTAEPYSASAGRHTNSSPPCESACNADWLSTFMRLTTRPLKPSCLKSSGVTYRIDEQHEIVDTIGTARGLAEVLCGCRGIRTHIEFVTNPRSSKVVNLPAVSRQHTERVVQVLVPQRHLRDDGLIRGHSLIVLHPADHSIAMHTTITDSKLAASEVERHRIINAPATHELYSALSYKGAKQCLRGPILLLKPDAPCT